MNYYLLIVHRHIGPTVVTHNESNKILVHQDLDKAKVKAQEVLDSGDYKAGSVSVLPVSDLDKEHEHTQNHYHFED